MKRLRKPTADRYSRLLKRIDDEIEAYEKSKPPLKKPRLQQRDLSYDSSSSLCSSSTTSSQEEQESDVSSESTAGTTDESSQSSESEDHTDLLHEAYFNVFFRGKGLPFGMDKEKDILVLDPDCQTSPEIESILSHFYKEIVLFARHISTFKTGSFIRKSCGPWGDHSILAFREFVIEKKFFRADGTLDSVTLRCESHPHCEYSISSAFFAGWTDTKARELYYEFAK